MHLRIIAKKAVLGCVIDDFVFVIAFARNVGVLSGGLRRSAFVRAGRLRSQLKQIHRVEFVVVVLLFE